MVKFEQIWLIMKRFRQLWLKMMRKWKVGLLHHRIIAYEK